MRIEKLAAKGRAPTEGDKGRAVGRLRIDLPGLLLMNTRAAVGDVIPDLRIDWDMMLACEEESKSLLKIE